MGNSCSPNLSDKIVIRILEEYAVGTATVFLFMADLENWESADKGELTKLIREVINAG